MTSDGTNKRTNKLSWVSRVCHSVTNDVTTILTPDLICRDPRSRSFDFQDLHNLKLALDSRTHNASGGCPEGTPSGHSPYFYNLFSLVQLLLQPPPPMLFPLLGLVYFLAFSPQAVLSIFQLISYSFIQQCGPFNISFSGGVPPPDLPLTLTVLPFGSTPLSFTLPQSAWDNSTDTGSYVAFLPLPEGVSLIASLDDAFGNSAALASQVLQISSSHNTSCLSNTSITTTPPAFQLLDTNVSQCSPFSVTRKTTSPDYSISVRVFIPEGLSYWLQSISFDSSQGVDIYTFIMNVARGIQVALLFVDGKGNRQVSNLLSVAGDENSPTKCLEITSTSTAADSHLSLSRSAKPPATLVLMLTCFAGLQRLPLLSRPPLLLLSSSCLVYLLSVANGGKLPLSEEALSTPSKTTTNLVNPAPRSASLSPLNLLDLLDCPKVCPSLGNQQTLWIYLRPLPDHPSFLLSSRRLWRSGGVSLIAVGMPASRPKAPLVALTRVL